MDSWSTTSTISSTNLAEAGNAQAHATRHRTDAATLKIILLFLT
jgi:hypothetical protein